MITKTATHSDGTTCQAVYSDCETYRYDLLCRWSDKAPLLVAWMLNPSTATEETLDPTVNGVASRARTDGFGGFRIINLFAFRHPDPEAMRAVDSPVGPENDQVIASVLAQSVANGDLVVCGWGKHGSHLGRSKAAADLASASGASLHAYAINEDGSPRHPLYVAHAILPTRWYADVV